MVGDDIIYVSVLIGSVVLGYCIKRIHNKNVRQNTCTLIGIFVVAFCCKLHSIHTLVTIVVNGFIVKYTPKRYCHLLSFAWSFGYLALFRMTAYFGIPYPPPLANAVQLFLTLKCTSLAFEVHDSLYPLSERALSHLPAETVSALHQKYVAVGTDVSWMEMIHYCYSFFGVLTGPYYKYRVYKDFINNDKMNEVDSYTPLLKRLSYLPVICVAYLLTTHYFSINDTQTPEFSESNLLWRMFYVMPMFVIFRTRLYINFILSECSCITAGLGAYPAQSLPKYGQGPSDLPALDKLEETKEVVVYDFSTVRNINLYLTELGVTMRDGMRGWNMSVQYFQVHHVYRRFPIKSLRVIVVMAMTSFWHGLHPGYYLCFLSVPLAVFTSDVCSKAFRHPTDVKKQRIFDWLWWIVKMKQFEYMSMPFLLLDWNVSLAYWRSVYYFMHVITVILLLAGLSVKFMSKRKRPVKTD